MGKDDTVTLKEQVRRQRISETCKRNGVGKWMVGRKRPIEAIEKAAAKLHGRKRPPFSKEWREHISIAQRNRPPVSLESRQKMSINNARYWLGKKFSTHTIELQRKRMTGSIGYWRNKKRGPHTKEWNEKIRLSRIGDKHWNWQGGITPENKRIRNSKDYILWRTAVFMRDDYTCQGCRQIGGDLEADHIKPFALYPELRLAIDNGRTLCIDCHTQTETYGGKIYKYGRS